MELAELTCARCGGKLEQSSNEKLFECKNCGTSFLKHEKIPEESSLLAVADAALRSAAFDDAEYKYRDIITRFPNCHEAFWGLALASNGIVFVDDVLEGKKVPTCYIIKETSFLTDINYSTAITKAPLVLKDVYKNDAKRIEDIRKIWLEKAKNEPPYDIFICFKDSDKANGVDRTSDSIEIQNLYTHLIKKNYNVFFSRETLRGKVSENYEPYIYNALNTAPIMIVYAQKGEYLESTWVKNEWSRYIRLLTSGQKQENSLVVAYEKMKIEDLPKPLRLKQCMDASKKTFYEDLDAHIEKLMKLAMTPKCLIERVEIKYVEVAKKSSVVHQESVKARELGIGTIQQLTQDENGLLKMAKLSLSEEDFAMAVNYSERVLQSNSYNSEAILIKLLAEKSLKTTDSLKTNIDCVNDADISLFDKIISYAENKSDATKKLNILYDIVYKCINVDSCYHNKSTKQIENMLAVALKYKNNNNADLIDRTIGRAIEERNTELYDYILPFKGDISANLYIEYTSKMAKVLSEAARYNDASKYISKLVEVDSDNIDTRWLLLYSSHGCCTLEEYLDNKKINKCEHFDKIVEMLQVCKEPVEMNNLVLSYLIDSAIKNEDLELFDNTIKYISATTIAYLETSLSKMAKKLHHSRRFEDAARYYATLLGFNSNSYNLYWELVLCKTSSVSDDDICISDALIRDIPEYNTAITLAHADEDFLKKCVKILKTQKENIEKRKIERQIEEERLNKERIEAQIEKQKRLDREALALRLEKERKRLLDEEKAQERKLEIQVAKGKVRKHRFKEIFPCFVKMLFILVLLLNVCLCIEWMSGSHEYGLAALLPYGNTHDFLDCNYIYASSHQMLCEPNFLNPISFLIFFSFTGLSMLIIIITDACGGFHLKKSRYMGMVIRGLIVVFSIMLATFFMPTLDSIFDMNWYSNTDMQKISTLLVPFVIFIPNILILLTHMFRSEKASFDMQNHKNLYRTNSKYYDVTELEARFIKATKRKRVLSSSFLFLSIIAITIPNIIWTINTKSDDNYYLNLFLPAILIIMLLITYFLSSFHIDTLKYVCRDERDDINLLYLIVIPFALMTLSSISFVMYLYLILICSFPVLLEVIISYIMRNQRAKKVDAFEEYIDNKVLSKTNK